MWCGCGKIADSSSFRTVVSTTPVQPFLARDEYWNWRSRHENGGGRRWGVGDNDGHGDGSLEALRAGDTDWT